jgi:hypothetical protein
MRKSGREGFGRCGQPDTWRSESGSLTSRCGGGTQKKTTHCAAAHSPLALGFIQYMRCSVCSCGRKELEGVWGLDPVLFGMWALSSLSYPNCPRTDLPSEAGSGFARRPTPPRPRQIPPPLSFVHTHRNAPYHTAVNNYQKPI